MTSSWANQAVKVTEQHEEDVRLHVDIRRVFSEEQRNRAQTCQSHIKGSKTLSSLRSHSSASNYNLFLLSQQTSNFMSHSLLSDLYFLCVWRLYVKQMPYFRGTLCKRISQLWRSISSVSSRRMHVWLNWPSISEAEWPLWSCSVDGCFCPPISRLKPPGVSAFQLNYIRYFCCAL